VERGPLGIAGGTGACVAGAELAAVGDGGGMVGGGAAVADGGATVAVGEAVGLGTQERTAATSMVESAVRTIRQWREMPGTSSSNCGRAQPGSSVGAGNCW
jgi:hypothetical protein